MADSDQLRQCIDFCKKERIDWLVVSPANGYCLDNLDFLQQCPGVTGVHLTCNFDNMDGLYRMPKLLRLSSPFPNRIDFSAIPSLADLTTDWTKENDDSLLRSISLRRLWLRGYKPNSRDLTNLSLLAGLRYLHVVQSPIVSTQGAQEMTKLESVGLSYCPKLSNIEHLASLERLEELELDHCRKIPDLTIVGIFKRLRKLIIFDCGHLNSLRFINEMKELEFFSFVNAKVSDGDMTPLFKLRYAGFISKRNFSHTYEQVRDIIRKHQGDKALYKD